VAVMIEPMTFNVSFHPLGFSQNCQAIDVSFGQVVAQHLCFCGIQRANLEKVEFVSTFPINRPNFVLQIAQ
jgi:hypothetical protein